MDSGSLRIDSVSLRDSGIYVCVAQNSAGTAMAQVRLQVQGLSPLSVLNKFIFLSISAFLQHGGDVHIVLKSDSNPYAWQKKDLHF